MKICKNFGEEILILKMHTFFKNSKWNSKRAQKSKLRLAQKSVFFPMGPWTAGVQVEPCPVLDSTGNQWQGCKIWSPGVAGHLTLLLSLHMDCLSASLAAADLRKEQGHSSSASLVNSSCEKWSRHSPLSSADKKVLLKCKLSENVWTVTRLHPLQRWRGRAEDIRAFQHPTGALCTVRFLTLT